MGGTDSGLADAVTVGFVGGIGGTDSGLADAVMVGFVGGMGGTDSGLADAVTVGFVGGMGGTDNGLATATVATTSIAALKTIVRIFIERTIMTCTPYQRMEQCRYRLTQMGHGRYNKSCISAKNLWWAHFSSFSRQLCADSRHHCVIYSPYSLFVRHKKYLGFR
jgi:hypothetical protein